MAGIIVNTGLYTINIGWSWAIRPRCRLVNDGTTVFTLRQDLLNGAPLYSRRRLV